MNDIEKIGEPRRLDMLLDLPLDVSVELGRTRMSIQELLALAPGSVIELDKSAGDPVELYINDRPIAKGEVVIIDENFGVRLTSIVTTTERIKTLR
jgi:flagellar motor switch protein FliN/FliY